MIKLPIAIHQYQTIPSFTQPLAILYGQNKKYADMWVINNCVSVLFEYNLKSHNTTPYLHILPVHVMQNCCFFDVYRVPNQLLGGDLETLTKELLISGHYINTSIDTYYLSCHNSAYQKFHFVHPILIYGYKEDIFYVSDHFLGGNGNLSLKEVPIYEFIDGYTSAHTNYLYMNYLNGIYAIKYKQDINNYNINKDSIKNNLFFHINSFRNCIPPLFQDYIPLDSYKEYSDIKFPYGYSAILNMVDVIKHYKDDESLFIITVHGLLIHAKIINQIIIMCGINNLLINAEQYFNKCCILENKMLKNIISKRKTRVDVNLLEDIVEHDLSLCNQLYKTLIND